MTAVLSVKDLHKHFGNNHAVQGLSFDIQPGICLGLLGPNGAGKTTTIEMLEGIKQPSSGSILYHGEVLEGAKLTEYKRQVGIQFQATALMDYLTVREVLELFGGFYTNTVNIDQLIEQCDLVEFEDQQANKVSGGQKQRLLLAMALVNDPELVFLDEPTTGLDPQSRRNFWTLIKQIKARGKTVVLTTHYMDEAELLCDELLIVDHGTIIAEGSPKALLQKHFDSQRVTLNTAIDINVPKNIAKTTIENGHTVFDTPNPSELIQLLTSSSIDITGLQVSRPTLEDLFIKLTGHTLRA